MSREVSQRGRSSAARLVSALAAMTTLLACTSCTWLPHEFNLSPVYRQRLAEDGTPLEVDALWPLLHYELTEDGGHDFRVRPLYRRVTEPDQRDFVDRPAVEHQFLYPLGRVRTDAEQQTARLFPLAWWRGRTDDLGQRETDWYALFPLIWGGSRADGPETYGGVFPLFADLPDFLAYERLTFVLWPLYTRTERFGRTGHVFLWPFAGFGSGPDGYRWHRFLPLWSFADERSRRYRSILYPIFVWGTENLDSDDPVDRFWFWPLFGWQGGRRAHGLTLLFPLVQYLCIEGRSVQWDVLWPLFRYENDHNEFTPLYRWWFWPLVARTLTDRQSAWSFLWPLIWLQQYRDPEDTEQRSVVVPFLWSTKKQRRDGGEESFFRFWPLFEGSDAIGPDGRVERSSARFLAPWFWTGSNAAGVDEAYDFLWTLWERTANGGGDTERIRTMADLYSSRRDGDRFQASVPWLFSYEGDREAGTLRLFNFLPIPWSGTDQDGEAARPEGQQTR